MRAISIMNTILNIIFVTGAIVIFILLCIGIFFFIVTRGTLLYRKLFRVPISVTSHIYPAYSERWLIRIIDFQPLISALLLFQYPKIVDHIVAEVEKNSLSGKRMLITSCAFGNVIPRIVRACKKQHAERIIITDIIPDELFRVREKLSGLTDTVDFVTENAAEMKQKNGSVEINVLFFLLHELPHQLQESALREAGRVLSSGGKLILAEFHRPDALLMRLLSRLYFFVFEPYGFALWGDRDPVLVLEKTGKWTCERTTHFFGNYQVIIATKG